MSNHIDEALDAVLKAAGTALKNYSGSWTLDKMRDAMRKAMSDSYIAGSNACADILQVSRSREAELMAEIERLKAPLDYKDACKQYQTLSDAEKVAYGLGYNWHGEVHKNLYERLHKDYVDSTDKQDQQVKELQQQLDALKQKVSEHNEKCLKLRSWLLTEELCLQVELQKSSNPLLFMKRSLLTRITNQVKRLFPELFPKLENNHE